MELPAVEVAGKLGLGLLFLLICVCATARSPTVICVLEESNYHSVVRYQDERHHNHYATAIRALFQKDGADWLEVNDPALPGALNLYAQEQKAPGVAGKIPAYGGYTYSGHTYYKGGTGPLRRNQFPKATDNNWYKIAQRDWKYQ